MTWLRRLFAPPPKPPALPGPTVEAVAKLAAELASLRQRVHVAETRLRQQDGLLARVELQGARTHGHVMALTHDAIKAADQRCLYVTEMLGKTNVRVALLELQMGPPVYDGPVSDGRLDEALEAVALHGEGRD